ncbi:YczE/YyaS/YitT family protein [Bacillus mesophilum]|uniref:YitT family protein n=1 Tax=Bacillus mesophilum TaxID=1071718 RepID=A0A7V7RNH4_9BACI|nr:YitT family protein [Bacillus mesophilum]KAB2334023.1 YitT family protein [Bacillus mesophilum]
MNMKRRGQIGPRFSVYLLGLLVMSLGIDLVILADLGASPWDVLHVGLYYQFGLSIGSWSIIVGIAVLIVSALISKEMPKAGAYLNMILVGLFIDMYMLLPFMDTPSGMTGKLLMFSAGILINCYGMGLYISAQLGAGPRDSLMIALTSKTGWKVGRVRAVMEILVLIVGWQLGGPVFWGTVFISLCIGPLVGKALPQCQKLTDLFLASLRKQPFIDKENRGVNP